MTFLPPDFHFLRPLWFWALAPCVLMLLCMFRANNRVRGLEDICDPGLLPHLLLEASGVKGRRWWLAGPALFWIITVIALAGPVWSRQPQPVFHLKTGRVICLDLSPSMAAADVKPSRLKRAKFKIRDILQRSREGLTGLVVFSSEAYVVVPLTDDVATIEAMLPALSVGIMPVSGNRAEDALSRAASLLRQAGVRDGEIILITDGVSDMASTLDEINRLRKEGVRVSVIGVGTRQGAPVPAPGGGFVMNADGRPVISRLDRGNLKEIARAGGGVYTRLTPDDSDILRILQQDRVRELAQSAREKSRRVDKWKEEGPWLVLLLLPLALCAFRRGWLLVIFLAVLLGLPHPSFAFTWKDLWLRPDQQAWELYKQGRYGEAARLFRDPERKAAALYKQGKFKEAAKLLERQHDERSLYNRGNSLARSGRLQEALKAYEQALKINPDDKDARFNRDLIKRLLEQRHSKNQQNKSGKDGGKKARNSHGQHGNGSGKDGKEKQKRGGQSKGAKGKKGGHAGKDSSGMSTGGHKKGAGKPGHASNNMERPEKESQRSGSAVPKRADREKNAKSHAGARPKTGQEAGPKARNKTQNPAGYRPGVEARVPTEAQKMKSEKEQALEQWLRQIPDDPSGLLRRKFYMEHEMRMQDQR